MEVEKGIVLFLWVEINGSLCALPIGQKVYKMEPYTSVGEWRTSIVNLFNIISKGWHNLWYQSLLLAVTLTTFLNLLNDNATLNKLSWFRYKLNLGY